MTSDQERSANDAFGTELAGPLNRRAGQLDVHPDLDNLLERAAADGPDDAVAPGRNIARKNRLPSVAAGPMRTALATAAVILVGLIGVLAVSALAGDEQEFAIQDAVSEAMAADGGIRDPVQHNTVIIWLDVAATEVDVAGIAELLDLSPVVTEYRYVNRVETYAEFREYFSDEPEIIELVSPEQLPTSFVVTTTNPTALAAAAGPLAAVDEVEIGDGRDPDSDD